MSLTDVPEDFGQGGANIGDGKPRLVDFLTEHKEAIDDHESRMVTLEGEIGTAVDSTARTAAAAAQSTADGAVAVNGTQATAITAAAAAAAAAQGTANGAVTVNGVQNGRLDALEAASFSPVTLAEKFTARFKSLNPTGYPILQFDDLEIQGNAEEPSDTQWRLMNGTVRSADHLTVVKCDGNGNMGIVAVGRPGSAALHPRTGKWHFGGAAYFNNQVVGVDDWRGFTVAGAALDFHDMIGMGIFNEVSSTKFGWLLKVGNVVKQAVPSTINAGTAGWHVFEIWSDGSSIFGSVDFETPILITAAIGTDAPNGNLNQIHGAISGTNTIYVDAVGTSSERL